MSDVVDTGSAGGTEQGGSETGSIAEVSSEGLAEALAAAKAELDAGRPAEDEFGLPIEPDADAPKPAAAKAQETLDEDLKSIEKTLARRRSEAQEKLKLRQEFEQERQKLETERSAILAQQKEVQEAARWIKRMKDNPAEAIRMLGIEPEDFIADLANAGTPEHKQKTEFERYQAELASLKAQLAERDRAEKEYEAQRQQAYASQLKSTAENQFLGTALSDDFPTLKGLFSGHRKGFLLEEAHGIAEEYYQATGGKVADFRDIANYLEEQYASSVGVSNRPTQGKPPQGKRGAVTLGSIQTERSTGFDPSEEDSDEDAVKKAIAATRNELKRFAG